MLRIIENIIISCKSYIEKKRGEFYNKESFLSIYQKCRSPYGRKVLGEGGNAIVYYVQNIKTKKHYALKFLKKTKKEKVVRFLEEIDIINANYKQISGILPIVDYSRIGYWYTMPLAESVTIHIKKSQSDIYQVVKDYLILIDTFVELHRKGISHRDIKPDNIYYYNGRYYIGDFGLVGYPDKNHKYTRSDQAIGAIFTIAPEMRRDPKNVKDARKADVYSLAKTLWMLITKDYKGFDGSYSYTNQMYALRLKPEFREVHLAELELLLTDSTDDNPDVRPTIEEFRQRLTDWLKITNDMKMAAVSDWNFLNKLIFKGEEPVNCIWNTPERIVEILNFICILPTGNHVLFSEGGGLDMTEASTATEKDCICICFGKTFNCILKPKTLRYDTFNDDPSWNYLILEADTLAPVFDVPKDRECEELIEDFPGHYVDASYFQYGVYDYENGKKLPKGARLVERYIKGSFLIVLKCGLYNSIPETYDGRHSECSQDKFRKYIEGICNILHNPQSNHQQLSRTISSLKKTYDTDLSEESSETKNYAPDDFVRQNYKKWNFVDCLPKDSNSASVMSFQMEVRLTSWSHFYLSPSYWILEDGSIGNVSTTKKAFIFYDRDEFRKSYDKIMAKVELYAKEEGYDGIGNNSDFSFLIKLALIGKPTHLFTKAEIEYLMRNADDRVNNQLVIDENGYAHILTERGINNLYPVSHETWCAGKNYVGRYSSLSDLDSAYIDSLVCWLDFLKTGIHQYCDYNMDADEKEIIKEIKKYY